jgi:DNA primase
MPRARQRTIGDRLLNRQGFMSFSPDFLDEIRARIRVSEVVGRRVRLQRRGREFVGLSPFNNEKTPSFTVNDQKAFYHCFSSGKHGDIFTFLMDVDGLSFPEAVETLAQETGLEVPTNQRQSPEAQDRNDRLRKAMLDATEFFEQRLHRESGRAAMDYLRGRGLSAEIINEFKLGFAPGAWTDLKEALEAKGHNQKLLAEAGLIIAGPDIKNPHDRFRDRVIFPIMDNKGRPIAFGGRAMTQGERTPKYLNSPETPLFHKGRMLYNLARARRAIHETGAVMVAEGYMDVIALAAAGFDNAVAPLGTALTDDQLDLLWRSAPEPLLCFDGDKAGRGAAYRALDLALPKLKAGHSLRFAMMPAGMDPDDVTREMGAPGMQAIIDGAEPLSALLWRRETEAEPLDTPERRAAFEKRLGDQLRRITDQTVAKYYKDDFRRRLAGFFEADPSRGFQRFEPRSTSRSGPNPGFGRRKVGSGGITNSLKNSVLAQGAAPQIVLGGPADQGAALMRESVLVLTILNHPQLLDEVGEDFAAMDISSPELDRLRREIIDIAALGEGLEKGQLMDHLNRRGVAEIADRHASRDVVKGIGFTRMQADFAEAELGWREIYRRHRRAVRLQSELDDVVQTLGQEITDENFQRLKALTDELHALDGEALGDEIGKGM